MSVTEQPTESIDDASPAATSTAADGAISIFDNEELLHELQPSWLAQPGTRAYLVLTLITMGMAAPFLLIPYLRAQNSWYVITSKRLIDIQGGVTGSKTVETPYDDITGDVRTSQSFLEGLLDKGSISFEIERARRQTASAGSYEGRQRDSQEMTVVHEPVELTGIPEYQTVSNTVRRIQNE